MNEVAIVAFEEADMLRHIDALDANELDNLGFGVIGFAAQTVVRRYNALESRMAGLAPERVLGNPLFTVSWAATKVRAIRTANR